MKTKTAKISVLVCTLALVLCVIFALTACGGATKYTYSSTKVEVSGESVDGLEGTMKTMYDNMYKNSYITVSDSKLVWTISDADSAMSVKRDGDKYILSGDYVDQMKSTLSTGLGSGTVSFDMYGLETDGGFDIIISASATVTVGEDSYTSGSKLTISFAK